MMKRAIVVLLMAAAMAMLLSVAQAGDVICGIPNPVGDSEVQADDVFGGMNWPACSLEAQPNITIDVASDELCPNCSMPCWCKPKKVNYDSVNLGEQFAHTSGKRSFAANDFLIDKIQEACPCDCGLYNFELIRAGDQQAVSWCGGKSVNTVAIRAHQS